MEKSMRIRATDELAIFRLIGECRELGADALAWQARLNDGIRHLTGGIVAGAGILPGGPMPPDAKFVAGAAQGDWPSEETRTRFHAWMTDASAVALHPAVTAFMGIAGDIVARRRRALVDDDTWNRSQFVNEELRPNGLDEGLIARCPTTVGPNYVVTTIRPHGDLPFNKRSELIVDHLLMNLTPLLGRGLWLTTQPNIGTLGPRRRQVLDYLLEGDSEKQVARRLGLHPTTVHDHVKAIYRHFDASSRPELMAIFLRRTLAPERLQ